MLFLLLLNLKVLVIQSATRYSTKSSSWKKVTLEKS